MAKPKPQPQGTAPSPGTRTGKFNFAKGSSNSDSDNLRSQDVPTVSQWKSSKDEYRYDKNENSKNEEETCSLNDNPVYEVNEENL